MQRKNAVAAWTLVALVALVPVSARADWVGHVSFIIADVYANSGQVVFQIDAASPGCPAGSDIYYTGTTSPEGLRAMFAFVIAMNLSRRLVWAQTDPVRGGCNAILLRGGS